VATDDEALVWLYSRRRSVPLYLESYRGRELIRPTPAEHRAYLERMEVTHVLLASATSPSAIELRAMIGAYPSLFTAIYRWPDGRWLFAVNRGQYKTGGFTSPSSHARSFRTFRRCERVRDGRPLHHRLEPARALGAGHVARLHWTVLAAGSRWPDVPSPSLASFAVDWAIAGGHPAWFHAINLLWHAGWPC